MAPAGYVLEPLSFDPGPVLTQAELAAQAEARIRDDKRIKEALLHSKDDITSILQSCLDRINDQLEHGEPVCTKAHFPPMHPFDFEDLEALADHDFTIDLHVDEVDCTLRKLADSIFGVVRDTVPVENRTKFRAMERYSQSVQERMELLEHHLEDRAAELSNCRYTYLLEVTHLREQIYRLKAGRYSDQDVFWFGDPSNADSARYQDEMDKLRARVAELEDLLGDGPMEANSESPHNEGLRRVLVRMVENHGARTTIHVLGAMEPKEMKNWALEHLSGLNAEGESDMSPEKQRVEQRRREEMSKLRKAVAELTTQTEDEKKAREQAEEEAKYLKTELAKRRAASDTKPSHGEEEHQATLEKDSFVAKKQLARNEEQIAMLKALTDERTKQVELERRKVERVERQYAEATREAAREGARADKLQKELDSYQDVINDYKVAKKQVKRVQKSFTQTEKSLAGLEALAAGEDVGNGIESEPSSESSTESSSESESDYGSGGDGGVDASQVGRVSSADSAGGRVSVLERLSQSKRRTLRGSRSSVEERLAKDGGDSPRGDALRERRGTRDSLAGGDMARDSDGEADDDLERITAVRGTVVAQRTVSLQSSEGNVRSGSDAGDPYALDSARRSTSEQSFQGNVCPVGDDGDDREAINSKELDASISDHSFKGNVHFVGDDGDPPVATASRESVTSMSDEHSSTLRLNTDDVPAVSPSATRKSARFSPNLEDDEQPHRKRSGVAEQAEVPPANERRHTHKGRQSHSSEESGNAQHQNGQSRRERQTNSSEESESAQRETRPTRKDPDSESLDGSEAGVRKVLTDPGHQGRKSRHARMDPHSESLEESEAGHHRRKTTHDGSESRSQKRLTRKKSRKSDMSDDGPQQPSPSLNMTLSQQTIWLAQKLRAAQEKIRDMNSTLRLIRGSGLGETCTPRTLAAREASRKSVVEQERAEVARQQAEAARAETERSLRNQQQQQEDRKSIARNAKDVAAAAAAKGVGEVKVKVRRGSLSGGVDAEAQTIISKSGKGGGFILIDSLPAQLETTFQAEIADLSSLSNASRERTLDQILSSQRPPHGDGDGFCERGLFIKVLREVRMRVRRMNDLIAMAQALQRGEMQRQLEIVHFLMESGLPDEDVEIRDLLFGRGLTQDNLTRSTGRTFVKLERRWNKLAGRTIDALLKEDDDIEMALHINRRAFMPGGGAGSEGAGGGLPARERKDFSPGKLKRLRYEGTFEEDSMETAQERSPFDGQAIAGPDGRVYLTLAGKALISPEVTVRSRPALFPRTPYQELSPRSPRRERTMVLEDGVGTPSRGLSPGEPSDRERSPGARSGTSPKDRSPSRMVIIADDFAAAPPPLFSAGPPAADGPLPKILGRAELPNIAGTYAAQGEAQRRPNTATQQARPATATPLPGSLVDSGTPSRRDPSGRRLVSVAPATAAPPILEPGETLELRGPTETLGAFAKGVFEPMLYLPFGSEAANEMEDRLEKALETRQRPNTATSSSRPDVTGASKSKSKTSKERVLKTEGARSESNLCVRFPLATGGDGEQRVERGAKKPGRVDLDRLLHEAKAVSASGGSCKRHLERVRQQIGEGCVEQGPVPSWVYERYKEQRTRPVGGRHTTGLWRNEPQEARAATQLRRTASAGRIRPTRPGTAASGVTRGERAAGSDEGNLSGACRKLVVEPAALVVAPAG